MATRLSFDEIDPLLEEYRILGGLKENANRFIDDVLDMLIMGYVWGETDADEQLGGRGTIDPDSRRMMEVIFREVAGEDFEDRLRKYAEADDYESAKRVMETDLHRVYNEAAAAYAGEHGATKKTWHTMRDPRVREAHDWLEGSTAPIDGKFYVDGDEARYPGDFESAELNVNCRCYLTYS